MDADDAAEGAADAPVTVVAFLDFQCASCSHAEQVLEELEREYGPDKLRVVFKHRPMRSHPDAAAAALAAQAVQDLGGTETFVAFARLLLQDQQGFGEQDLVRMAESVGVERGLFLDAARSARVEDEVRQDVELATRLGIDTAPAFRVNGRAAPVGGLRQAVDDELAEAQRLVASGVRPADVYAARVTANLRVEKRPPAAAPSPRSYDVPIGSSPVLGPASAPNTIVVFSDFQCPFCKQGEQVVRELMRRHPGRIRLVFKHEPLPFHVRALPAAMLAIEARRELGDAGFWKVHDLLFESQPKLADADLARIARQAGVDPAHAQVAVAREPYRSVVADDMRLADKLGVEATPTFFVNGKKIEGVAPIEDFERLLDQ